MPSINYRGPRRYNLNPFVWYSQPLNEAGHYEIVLKSARVAQTPNSRRLWVSVAVSLQSSCVSGPHSNQSAEEVLALNAAAIIANIKLQRQLSKKKTSNGNSEKDTTASPQGNTGIITSLFPSYVIRISHRIKHWFLLQLTENVASSILFFSATSLIESILVQSNSLALTCCLIHTKK